jgi:hypothetical protein
LTCTDLSHDILYGCLVAPATCVTVDGRTFTRPGAVRYAGSVATGEDARKLIERLLAIGFTEVLPKPCRCADLDTELLALGADCGAHS